MRTLLTFLVIAGVVGASNLRGDDESRELQTVIDATSSRGGRSRSTGRGQDLYIVEEDNSRRTRDCADDTAEEFEDDFRNIYIVDDDDDAYDGDIVAVIDTRTNCEDLWDDIEEELDDRHTTNTVFVYYGSGKRYYRNRGRGRRGYKLYFDRKRGRSRSGRYWGGWGKRKWDRKYGRKKRSSGGRKDKDHDHDHWDRKDKDHDHDHWDGKDKGRHQREEEDEGEE